MTADDSSKWTDRDEKWEHIRRRMEAVQAILRRKGCVIDVKDSIEPRYAIHYAFRAGGKRVQRRISIGKDTELVRRAVHLLAQWREEYRRSRMACRWDTAARLMEIPAWAGYGGAARAAYRRALRTAGPDQVELLNFLADFDVHEARWPGVKRLRSNL